jgi:hypothetical protein
MKKRKPRIALRSHERDALDAIASTVRREKIYMRIATTMSHGRARNSTEIPGSYKGGSGVLPARCRRA